MDRNDWLNAIWIYTERHFCIFLKESFTDFEKKWKKNNKKNNKKKIEKKSINVKNLQLLNEQVRTEKFIFKELSLLQLKN